MMARPKETFPFVPNMEDCKMIVHSHGATCYIMDTCCKHFTKEDKARADARILEIARNAALRKLYAAAIPPELDGSMAGPV